MASFLYSKDGSKINVSKDQTSIMLAAGWTKTPPVKKEKAPAKPAQKVELTPAPKVAAEKAPAPKVETAAKAPAKPKISKPKISKPKINKSKNKK